MLPSDFARSANSNMATVLGDPMSALPISPPASPTKPLVYYKWPPSDIPKPNPHPYPIKTTSTDVPSRSKNSITKSNSPYQFYVPQSPGSLEKESRSSRGDKERRGGRHRFSESLNSNTNPTPLPVPDRFAAPTYRERRGTISSHLSVESGTADVFGGVVDNTYTVALGKRKHRTGTISPSTAAAFEASISSSGSIPDSGDKWRGRTYHTVGRRSGGKVRGMVTSFERSFSGSGDEDEDGDKDALVHLQDYGHRRTRHRSRSDHSVGSYSSASPGPSRSHGSKSNLKSYFHELQEDSTPRRHQDRPREPESSVVPSEESTMEQLLASFPSPNPVLTSRDPTLNNETMKLQNVVVEAGFVYPRTVATAINSASAPVTVAAAESTGPAASTSDIGTTPLFDVPSSRGSMLVSHSRSIHASESEEELTVEQLFALSAIRGKDGDVVAGGANAWERVAPRCTIKRVEEAAVEARNGVIAAGPVVIGTGRRSTRVKSAKVLAEKDKKKRLEDVFLPVSDKDEFKGKEETRAGEARLPSSAVDRQLRFEQEMSETKEMVRALSARVASVEARIGEMERAVGDLKVKLMSEEEVGNVDEDGTTRSEDSALRLTERPMWPTRSVVGLARVVVRGASDGVWTRLASVVPLPLSFSSSQPSSSAATSASDATTETDPLTQAREVSKTRGSNSGIPMWYKRSWTYYLLFLGLGACASVLREVARRGLLLRRLGPRG